MTTPLAVALSLLVLALSGCRFGSERMLVEDSLQAALETKGRVECEQYEQKRALWECQVEVEFASGSSRYLHLKVGANDCWRARHVALVNRRPSGPRSDLPFDGAYAYGPTIRGCLDS